MVSKRKQVAIVAAVGILSLSIANYVAPAKAAALGTAMLRLDRMSTSATTGGRVCAKPTSTATEAKVRVTFPTGFTINTTASNWTANTTNLDSGQTAWPTIGTATVVSGQAVTFASGDLTAGTLYCFNFSGTNTLTTRGTTGNNLTGTIETLTSADVVVDSAQYATSIISNDQIVVTAAVGATFTFALDGNNDTFAGNLGTTVSSTSGRTVTLTTNAAQGWIVWAKNLQNSAGVGSLFSTTASKHIAASAAVGTASRAFGSNVEDYGMGVTAVDAAGGGTVTVDTAYDGTSSKAGTLDPTTFRKIASSNGTANADVLTLIERAVISNSTPAASDYTDTITVVGAGQF